MRFVGIAILGGIGLALGCHPSGTVAGMFVWLSGACLAIISSLAEIGSFSRRQGVFGFAEPDVHAQFGLYHFCLDRLASLFVSPDSARRAQSKPAEGCNDAL